MILCLMMILGGGGAVPHYQMVELNHYQPDKSKPPCFSQLIIWEYSPEYRRWHAEGWVLVNDRPYSQTRVAGRHHFWFYAKDGKQCHITANRFRETVTAKDPERENNRLYPPEYRHSVFR